MPGSWKSQILEEGAGKSCLAGARGRDLASQGPSQHTALANKKQSLGPGPTGEKASHQKSDKQMSCPGDSGKTHATEMRLEYLLAQQVLPWEVGAEPGASKPSSRKPTWRGAGGEQYVQEASGMMSKAIQSSAKPPQ